MTGTALIKLSELLKTSKQNFFFVSQCDPGTPPHHKWRILMSTIFKSLIRKQLIIPATQNPVNHVVVVGVGPPPSRVLLSHLKPYLPSTYPHTSNGNNERDTFARRHPRVCRCSLPAYVYVLRVVFALFLADFTRNIESAVNFTASFHRRKKVHPDATAFSG